MLGAQLSWGWIAACAALTVAACGGGSGGGGQGGVGGGAAGMAGGAAGQAGGEPGAAAGTGGAAAGAGGDAGAGAAGQGGGQAGQAGGAAGGPDAGAGPDAARSRMTFFVSSEGMGAQGANYGGLAGADAHCQRLAQAAGGGDHTWRAYLSADAADGQPAVNARDRIGAGPWFNQRGQMIAGSLQSLHSNGVQPAANITEKGVRPNTVSEHDILTGSQGDGTLKPGGYTCRNWTSSANADQGWVGHSHTQGIEWNNAHASRCDAAGLRQNNGIGLIYCFAVD